MYNKITKNCNPNGELSDSLGDNIDNMNKELANWIKDNKLSKDRSDELYCLCQMNYLNWKILSEINKQK